MNAEPLDVDDGAPELDEGLGPLEQAHAALHLVERFGAMDADETFRLRTESGVTVHDAQSAYLAHAQACALVAIADSLAVLVAAL